MYVKTLKLGKILEKINQESFSLEGVSQETINALIQRGLIVELSNLTSSDLKNIYKKGQQYRYIFEDGTKGDILTVIQRSNKLYFKPSFDDGTEPCLVEEIKRERLLLVKDN